MAMHPNLLIIRHEQCTSLGMLKKIVEQKNVPIKHLDILEDEKLSEPITNYSHIVVLGGTISAYEDQKYPLLKEEFRLIEAAISAHIPIAGICLGSQVLARVLGAQVYRGEAGREAGWCEVQLQENALGDRLLKGFPQRFKVFQSHQDTFDIPANSVHLAQSDKYPNQAFRYEDFVWAIQFHLEMDEHVLSDCSGLIEQELIDSGVRGTTVEQIIQEAMTFSPAVQPLADQFMEQFLLN
jgi:GMP synthase (glutamine-hydrolysing)